MKGGIAIIAGIGFLAYLLSGKGEGVTAAEGFAPLKKVVAEITQAGETGFGVVTQTAKSGLSITKTGGRVSAVDLGPFGGYKFASKKELMKAQLDPSQFESVTGAGFEWTKAGRYQYKQYLKTEARAEKAAKAGYSSFGEYAAAKELRESYEERAAILGIAASKAGGDTEYIANVAESYQAPSDAGLSPLWTKYMGGGEE